MKWEYKPEMRTKALMKTVLCRERLPPVSARGGTGTLLADSMEQACDILKENEGRAVFFILDGNYEHFIFSQTTARENGC